MRALLDILLLVSNLAIWVLVAQAIMSWLVAFNILDTRNPFITQLWRILYQVTEPIVGPVRRMLPAARGIDFAPLVVIFGIIFLQRVIDYYVYPNVF